MKNKTLPAVLLIVIMILTVFSCKQSSIFFNISTENPPNKPKIPGAPSKIVAITGTSAHTDLNNRLYLARKSVYSYNESTGWIRMPRQPSSSGAKGDIVDIAAAETALFVQTIDPYELWKTEDGENWTQIPNSVRASYPTLQGIYAVNDQLFASGAVRDEYGRENYVLLWYDKDGTGELVPLKGNMGGEGRLTGAVHAGNYYYLAMLNGIYALDDSSVAEGVLESAAYLPGSENKGIVGLITDIPETSLLAVCNSSDRDRILIAEASGNSSSFAEKYNSDVRFNRALSIAKVNEKYILMVGHAPRSGDYNYGYREIVLEDDGTFPDSIGRLNVPGSFSNSSITYNDKSEAEYQSSLGREVVTSIIQTPSDVDGEKILFASTFNKGLWSYRNGEWNAEE